MSHHKLFGFVDQHVFKMSMIVIHKTSKLVYSFESFSLKPRQRSRAIHFTVLAPREIRFSLTLHRIFSNRAQVLLYEDDCQKSENVKN